MPVYILERQKYIDEKKDIPTEKMFAGFVHVGYLKKLFRTKNKAAKYYDVNNKCMRGLNAHKTWCSDWHPTTKWRYVVRTFNGEILEIDDHWK